MLILSRSTCITLDPMLLSEAKLGKAPHPGDGLPQKAANLLQLDKPMGLPLQKLIRMESCCIWVVYQLIRNLLSGEKSEAIRTI